MMGTGPHILHVFGRWRRGVEAVAAVEMALIFPFLITMLLGIVDIGQAVLMNKKVISAAHIASDLLTRNISVTDDDLAQAIEAARLALDPYPTASFGIDIVGVQYQGVAAEPVAVWRETQNMAENGDVLAGSAGLGVENEGVVAVTVVYSYEPPFSGVFAGNVEMEEVTYARGRTTPFVSRE